MRRIADLVRDGWVFKAHRIGDSGLPEDKLVTDLIRDAIGKLARLEEEIYDLKESFGECD